ncbi:MAG: hypothetical protein ACLUD0_09190 [Eubacterium ramulus]
MQANYHEKIDRQKEKLEQRKIAASQMDTKNHFESVTAEENGIAEPSLQTIEKGNRFSRRMFYRRDC